MKTGLDPDYYKPALHPFLMNLSGSSSGCFNSKHVCSREKSPAGSAPAAQTVTEHSEEPCMHAEHWFLLDFRGKCNKNLYFLMCWERIEAIKLKGNHGGVMWGGHCLGKI